MKVLPTLTALLSLAPAAFAAEKYTIATIPKGTTLEFWKNVHAGGQMKIIGFDAGTLSVADLEKGNVQGLVQQNPMRIGGDALKVIVAHLQRKPVEKRIDTGVVVVPKENIADPANAELLRPPLEKYLK